MRLAIGIPRSNTLLAALSLSTYQRLHAASKPFALIRDEILCEANEAIRHVYFPTDSLISLQVPGKGHLALEVAVVGAEGLFGVALALGERISAVRATVRSAGNAMRMAAEDFRRELKRSPSLRRAMYRHAYSLVAQLAESAACHRFHVVEARLARWLLMTRDLLRTDEFHMTQESLAGILGVRRVGITMAAGALRQRQLIAYRRGKITILDRKGLRAAACPCYQIINHGEDAGQICALRGSK
ncbi:MAG: Crp/Fnr family transcriptional regulator [Burkholderiales bacterium]|nr:Crp/Fnr family transcriptional regulator [Burkholderiales bacterium]